MTISPQSSRFTSMKGSLLISSLTLAMALASPLPRYRSVPFTAFSHHTYSNPMSNSVYPKTYSVYPKSNSFYPKSNSVYPKTSAYPTMSKTAPEALTGTASLAPSSPTAAAALAYMKTLDSNDLCGASSLAYLESIIAGGSPADANLAASEAYQSAFASGARMVADSPCAAAEASFRSSGSSVLDSAVAFMNSWPGLQQGNPCAVAGKTYIDAVVAGQSQDNAAIASSKAYLGAFSSLARTGKALNDPACAAASKAFIATTDSIPSTSSSASAEAFIEQTLGSSASGFDPACASAATAYIDAFAAGNDSETSNLIAARAFYAEFSKGGSPANSPCIAASKAYAAKSPVVSNTNAAAMVAYMNSAIASGSNSIDPVCAAANLAFLDAKIAQSSDEAAMEIAASAYISALDANNGRDPSAPCAAAAQAFMEAY